jgi:ribosomal protein S12 methylthiotransferase accessory factor
VQVRTTYIGGSREDIAPADYDPATLQLRSRHARALMRPVGPGRDFAAVPGAWFDDFGSEVAWIVDRLKAAGMRQAVAVDLTMPEFAIPVVRAVVPGLEGSDHHPGYVPGARARAAQAELT